MAVLTSGAYTLADWAAMKDPDGKTAMVANLLSQSNQILDDMLWIEGNLPTGHRSTVLTGLPQPTWRLLNYGVQPSKGTRAQVTDACGMLEDYSFVDKALAELGGDVNGFRMTEAMPHIEGMSQTMAQTIFYGNSNINPERFTGLSPRYSMIANQDPDQSTARNILDGGGTGSTNASIWVITWSPNTVTGIFPKGSKAGLLHEDVTTNAPVYDASGGRYQAYQDHFKWDAGLAVPDWRYAVRICNIDTTLLNTTNAAKLQLLLIKALDLLPTAPSTVGPVQSIGTASGMMTGLQGRTAIYCNRAVRTALDIQKLNNPNTLLEYQQWDGQPVTTFRGIPVRNVDQLLSTEARVV